MPIGDFKTYEDGYRDALLDAVQGRQAAQKFTMSRFDEPKCRVRIKLDHPLAKQPSKSRPGDSAFDLYSVEDVWVRPGEVVPVSVGIKLAIPPGWYGKIRGRSGLACKSAQPFGGQIDENFRGVLKVLLYNGRQGDESESIQIKAGDRAAQIVFHRVEPTEFVVVDKLDDTERGEAGFGSSGQ